MGCAEEIFSPGAELQMAIREPAKTAGLTMEVVDKVNVSTRKALEDAAVENRIEETDPPIVACSTSAAWLVDLRQAGGTNSMCAGAVAMHVDYWSWHKALSLRRSLRCGEVPVNPGCGEPITARSRPWLRDNGGGIGSPSHSTKECHMRSVLAFPIAIAFASVTGLALADHFPPQGRHGTAGS